MKNIEIEKRVHELERMVAKLNNAFVLQSELECFELDNIENERNQLKLRVKELERVIELLKNKKATKNKIDSICAVLDEVIFTNFAKIYKLLDE